eukprot:gene14621-17096_t
MFRLVSKRVAFAANSSESSWRALAQPLVFNLSARFMSKERAGKAVKPGAALVIDGAPHKVLKITQGKRGKGGGYVRAYMKNVVTKTTTEKTFLVDETVEYAEMEKEDVQYNWNDGSNFYFMNLSTFEEFSLPKEECPDWEFFSEGQEVTMRKFKDEVISVSLPKVCEFTVLTIDETRTSSNFKAATIGGGAEIYVPMFIEVGTKIRVNVEE